MSRTTLNREFAWACAADAADRQMRRAGRAIWSEDDYNVAVAEFNRLWPEKEILPSEEEE